MHTPAKHLVEKLFVVRHRYSLINQGAIVKRGEAIEVNDEWWQQKCTNLINHLHQNK
ncbi:hypothetical protein [Nostoc sp. CALU 546]|uniref:hypothetical protein n=1 Tax=Nostoc sp. CALU 546 TaxID=1867241 RepID=UPI003B66C81E